MLKINVTIFLLDLQVKFNGHHIINKTNSRYCVKRISLFMSINLGFIESIVNYIQGRQRFFKILQVVTLSFRFFLKTSFLIQLSIKVNIT